MGQKEHSKTLVDWPTKEDTVSKEKKDQINFLDYPLFFRISQHLYKGREAQIELVFKKIKNNSTKTALLIQGSFPENRQKRNRLVGKIW